jgi:hypothetical protein
VAASKATTAFRGAGLHFFIAFSYIQIFSRTQIQGRAFKIGKLKLAQFFFKNKDLDPITYTW